MKKATFPKSVLAVCLTVIMLTLSFHTAKSQTFPFSEDFDSTPDTTLPAGWIKSNTNSYYGVDDYIDVYSNEGIANSKAVMLRIHTTYIYEDTLLTPVIGPITSNTILNVNYKFIQASDLNGTGTGPYAGGSFSSQFFWGDLGKFRISIINTSNNIQTVVFQADSTNHIPSMAYMPKTINLSSFAGQNIKIAFTFDGFSEDYFSEFWLDNVIVNDYNVSVDNSLDQKESTTVFPNPTKGELTFHCKEDVKATIYDVVGRIVYQENIAEPTHTIHLDKNPAGIYLVNVKGATTNKTYRIIKQ